MRAVVLGGGGFVGSHLCSALAAAGHEVVAAVRRPPAAMPCADVAVLDAADPGALRGLLRRTAPDAVVNAAGAVWRADGAAMEASNVVLVERLLTVLPELGRTPRLIQLGTIHEYGSAPGGGVLREDTVPAPLTPYGRTKLRATEAVLAAVRAGRADAVVLRVANVIGPGAPAGSLLGMVTELLAGARAAGRTATIRLASLGGHRDFADVRDVAGAVLLTAVPGTPAPRLVNIGGGRAVSVRSLVERLIEISGVPAELVTGTAPPSSPGAAAGSQRLGIDRARTALGWRPRRSPEESLRALWAAAMEQKEAVG
ncbi:NAD-dependent epimerase/dehydratase family protein [Actinomadura formosensis]|uniref:NAD-dependent epimerase/dehydratase family protein n=1 Tax=Actinomadura formosensis TaxID=60706 RepID=UPI00082D99EF|nr:NAD(P)-dependent oxidoreductase [Actinomadura formosensis]